MRFYYRRVEDDRADFLFYMMIFSYLSTLLNIQSAIDMKINISIFSYVKPKIFSSSTLNIEEVK